MTFEFQICDWNSYETIENEVPQYTMQLFGRTQTGEDVCLKVVDFTPYFYIEKSV